MKYSECNSRQKKAYSNIYHACNWLIGGLENTLLDHPEDSIQYKEAKDRLNNHTELVEELYQMATTDIYGEGSCTFGSFAQKYLKDIRFCGKQWLMERCEARIKKAGY